MNEFLQIAEYACDGGNKSQYLTSSDCDYAHKVGLFCRKKSINPLELKKSRGYTWILNRDFKLNFKDSDTDPVVTRINQ